MTANRAGAPSADDARAALGVFFEHNPSSEIIEVTAKDKTVSRINKPWGDTSVAFEIDEGFQDLADALNKLILPPRLSAIYHRDRASLEVIWTAYELNGSQKEIAGRKFEFLCGADKHQCEFGESSDELLVLAKSAIPVGMSSTNHRNIYSFTMHAKTSNKANDIKSKPRSFWIHNIAYDENVVVDFVNNLNFYITYYDHSSPYIMIHPPETEKIESKKVRYRDGKFPEIIRNSQLDENLLSFWQSAQSNNPFMKFLLHFRIIEYAAYHYIDETAKSGISRIIMSPDLLGNIPTAIDGIVSALSSTQKLHDSQRIRLTLKKCVKPEAIWPDIRDNQAFFSNPTCFDGGFTIGEIVGAKDKAENWGGHRMDSVADAFRKIRNALSHGKDQETTGVIRPTTRNLNLFRPWVHLISAAAGEVVLYKDAP